MSREWGYGKPVLGFLAEYDALPGLGQETCSTRKAIELDRDTDVVIIYLEQHVPGQPERLKAGWKQKKKSVTIRVYGCPAEEIVIDEHSYE